jgi:hypothetical protein
MVTGVTGTAARSPDFGDRHRLTLQLAAKPAPSR